MKPAVATAVMIGCGHMYTVIACSSSVAVCSAITFMMSYKKLDDKDTPFLEYRQITITLIREIRCH
jgi:hypothetical protein